MNWPDYKILVLTPSTLRPSLLLKTFSSFHEKMFSLAPKEVSFELALHIDCVGESNATDIDNLLIVNDYIRVTSCRKNRTPPHSLSRAFIWLWKQASKSIIDYVFYLEDDWELLKEVNVAEMIECFEHNRNLATLRLPFTRLDNTFSKNWAHKFPWNGMYFECPDEIKYTIGWCGHPGMVNVNFIRQFVDKVDPNWCPELRLKGYHDIAKEIIDWDYGVYGHPGETEYIKDIGREWRNTRGITKLKNTSWSFS